MQDRSSLSPIHSGNNLRRPSDKQNGSFEKRSRYRRDSSESWASVSPSRRHKDDSIDHTRHRKLSERSHRDHSFDQHQKEDSLNKKRLNRTTDKRHRDLSYDKNERQHRSSDIKRHNTSSESRHQERRNQEKRLKERLPEKRIRDKSFDRESRERMSNRNGKDFRSHRRYKRHSRDVSQESDYSLRRKREGRSLSGESYSSETSPTSSRPTKKSKWDMPTTTDNGPSLGGFSSYGSGLLLPTLQQPLEDRRGRRLYVGNLPPGISEAAVVQFFNGALLAASGVDYAVAAASGQFPVLKAESYLPDHRYCFVEFRTIADTSICLKLDGISFNGYMLKVGRPNDYTIIPRAQEMSTPEALATGSAVSALARLVPETKMYITDLPITITDDELRKLCEGFGTVRSAALMKDLKTGQSMGCGVVEFEDPAATEAAVKVLDRQPIGLKIPRFSKGPLVPSSNKLIDPAELTPHTSSIVTELPTSMTYKIFSNAIIGAQVKAARLEGGIPSKVVQLLNAVFPEDLIKDDDYTSIMDDIKTEASQYGTLIDVVIPRTPPDLSFKPGVGKVFLHFSDTTAARRAQAELNGRRYDQRRVICAAFYSVERFLEGKYTIV